MNAPRRLSGPLAVLFALGLLVAAFGARAVQVSDLFQVQVPVDSQDQQARADAIQQAMKEVLVRASGQGDTAKLPSAKAIVEDASQFVQQFRYMDNGPDQDGQSLWVKFDRVALAPRARAEKGPPPGEPV